MLDGIVDFPDRRRELEEATIARFLRRARSAMSRQRTPRPSRYSLPSRPHGNDLGRKFPPSVHRTPTAPRRHVDPNTRWEIIVVESTAPSANSARPVATLAGSGIAATSPAVIGATPETPPESRSVVTLVEYAPSTPFASAFNSTETGQPLPSPTTLSRNQP